MRLNTQLELYGKKASVASTRVATRLTIKMASRSTDQWESKNLDQLVIESDI